jgi:hypothetical protein
MCCARAVLPGAMSGGVGWGVRFVSFPRKTADDAKAERSDRVRQSKKIDKFIKKNPVFSNADFQDGDQWGLTPEQLFKFQEIFAIADADMLGYLGQIQFRKLMNLCKIELSRQQMEDMFADMDENNDNEITFDEFVAAMAKHLDDEQLEMAASIKPGASGTSRWNRGEIVWAANKGIITVVVGMGIQIAIYFNFILVPLSMAYFLMFLVAPLMNAFEFRPLECKGKDICDPYAEETDELQQGNPYRPPYDKDGSGPRYKSEGRQGMEGKPTGSLYDCATMCKFPHGLGVILTLVSFFATIAAIAALVYSELSVMLNDKEFVEELDAFVDDIYASLNESGIKVLRPEKEGYTPDEVAGYMSMLSNALNLFVTILLLWIYLIAEKVNPTVFDPTNKVLDEIENQVNE